MLRHVEIAAAMIRFSLMRAVIKHECNQQSHVGQGPCNLKASDALACFHCNDVFFVVTKHHGKMPTFRGAAAVLQSCLLLNVHCVVCWPLASNSTRGGVGLVFLLQFSFVSLNAFFKFHFFLKLIMRIRSSYFSL